MSETKPSHPPLTRTEEEEKLAGILRLAQSNLEKTENTIRQLSEELHVLTETYGPKDTEALSLLHNTQAQLAEARHDLIRCQKARKKPYFGRIDFKDKKQPAAESYYVGRVGIAEDGSNPVVIDWRAPAASVYYENALGPCRYEVKNHGFCEIDLLRKRTYEIENDRLKNFYDSDIVATDELLNKYLAQNKRAVLSEIIATIQQEQNAIIRRSPRINLIVQGVAGSGKTTVAMHRISYILYNYAEDFRPEDFYIIGSNRILLNYITSVLPDLDVYGVRQMTMEQLFIRLLYEDWDPRFHQVRPADTADPQFCLKSSLSWFQDLAAFCAEYERREIPGEDVRLKKTGALLLSAAAIRACLETHPDLSMQEKKNLLNETLVARLENELSGKYVSCTPEEKKELFRTLRRHFGQKRWKGSIFEVYREFLQSQQDRGKTVSMPEPVFESGSFSQIQAGCTAFDLYDLAALAYLYRRIKETDRIREASHMIIDEAQDFGMMAYSALAFCLRGCTYTIMGDISQNIHFGCGLNDWEELKRLILTGDFDRFDVLKKSYRNTVEIAHFAADILRHGNFPVYPSEPVNRRGSQVRVIQCADEKALTEECIRTIRAWQSLGHETIAVICRDEAQAEAVSARLRPHLPLADSNPQTARFDTGILVLPVEYTKGLEFDAVLLYDPSKQSYPVRDAFVKRLYVAATRALHELAVLHQGDLTDLIGQPPAPGTSQRTLEAAAPVVVRGRASGSRKMTVGKSEDAVATDSPGRTANDGPLTNVASHAAHGSASAGGASRTAHGGSPTGGPSRTAHGGSPTGGPSRTAGSGASAGSAPQAAHGGSPAGGPSRAVHGGSPTGGPSRTAGSGASAGSASRAHRANAGCASGRPARPLPVNPSPHRFGDIPEQGLLYPPKPRITDFSIRGLKKTKHYLDADCGCGTLRLTPISDRIFRVQFQMGSSPFPAGFWRSEPETAVAWTAKAGKTLAEAATESILVRISKKTGALSFFDKDRQPLLSENPSLPRQIPQPSRAWVYFDWEKSEKLSVKGILADDLERINHKARYISFGGLPLRMPLLVSDRGYGIGIAGPRTVLCCAVPSYGNYIYMDGTSQIDYYFLFGGSYAATLELYKTL
ncbi:MAG TPA: DUF4968 domain-containing protein [Candidatus Limivivens intestinipullorum]|uniref:DUF4968 domain-containing protein n=1 Tax=Candidatus Limivivens intestinipullorum TaxID=2840858 RepID=A0A9D1ERC1_9FIRM|nr:DUF4968 domain-containing protein [Candidatus Limivivens intestinipullorum]